MAAPTPTARTTPTGYKLPEGFRVTIAFSAKPALAMWEMSVKPGGFTATLIDTSTQHSIKLRSKVASALADYDEYSGTSAYDPDFFSDILSLFGYYKGSVTVHMPDDSKIVAWAMLRQFDFQPLEIGKFPMANYAITPTNFDYNTGTEQSPVYYPSVGT